MAFSTNFEVKNRIDSRVLHSLHRISIVMDGIAGFHKIGDTSTPKRRKILKNWYKLNKDDTKSVGIILTLYSMLSSRET